MDTPPRFDRTTQDIGNLVEFGHLNVRVADQQKAIVFYVMGLGLTRDPFLTTGVDNAWMNVGTSQFHLPVGQPQVLRGRVGLVMPDLDALAVRLDVVAPRLSGSCFDFTCHGSYVDVSCPWGNRIRVHEPDATRFGALHLGMPYVEIDTAPGTASRIARFYREVFANLAHTTEDSEGSFAEIPVGLHEKLVYRERHEPLPPYDGHHIQVAVADFSGVHRRLIERRLITEESNQSQYRFEDIIDIDTGEVLATIEHEVRSMRHPMYGRPLINRNTASTNANYLPGREVAAWQLS
jgi:hypothetical protein